MVKVIFAFVFLTLAFALGIEVFRKLSGMEKWEVIKVVGYGFLCSVITICFLTGIVILF
jgi:hypothetical protein